MKSYKFAIPLIAAGLALSPLCHAATNSSALMKEATVTEAQARDTALQQVPRGTVKSSELEREHGRLIWTFDIEQPSVAGVTEVHIDARTGKIVAVKKETPAQEAKESKAGKASTKQ